MTDSLVKQPSESRLYDMEFATLLLTGETLTGVTSVTEQTSTEDVDGNEVLTTTTDLTFSGAPAYSGTLAQQRIEDGVDGTLYKITFLVTTSASNILEGEGYMLVSDI